MSNPQFGEYSQIAHAMKGVAFPVRRNGIIASAKENHAPENVIKDLERLQERHEYHTIAEVLHALGHHSK